MKTRLLSILLITAIIIIACGAFFIYTTTMSSPNVMNLHEAKGEKNDAAYQNLSTKLTVILLGDDRIYGYYENNIGNGKSLAFNEIRNLVVEGVEKYTKDSLVVIVKPTKGATYKNTVDMLDEMSINGIKRYSMTDPNKEEMTFLKITE